MQKRILLIAVILGFMIGLMPTETRASHNTGGDITYAYTGTPNTFLLTYRFYRDCSGIPAPSQIQLHYGSATAAFHGCVTLLPIPGTGNQIPNSVCVPVVTTTCNGGTGYGVQEWIFQGTVVLPSAQPDWIFDYSECCRNATCYLVGQPGLYIYTTLDNVLWPTNSSPVFATLPVTQFCVNNPFYYVQNATDVDGDYITYQLVDALDGSGSCTSGYTQTPVQYIAPHSGIYPFPTTTGTVVIDTATGVISFTPTACCNGVMCVEATEHDPTTGVIKSTIRRDIQVNIACGCTLIPPSFDSTFQTTGITITEYVTCDDTTFWLVFDSAHLIQCGSVVPTDIRVTSPNGTPNPVVSATPFNCVNGLTDSVLITTLNPLVAGTSFAFTKIGNDGNTFLSECGTPMIEFDSIPLTIIDSSVVNAYADSVGCAFDSIVIHFNQPMNCYDVENNGSDFTVKDGNQNNITVVSASCYTHYNQTMVLHVPPGTVVPGPLVVTVKNGTDGNTISNSCETYLPVGDTICIVNVLGYYPVNLGPDITLCSNANPPVFNAGNGPGGTVYSWTLNGTTLPNSTQYQIGDSSGTYIVSVNVNASCTGADTVVVNYIQAPTVNIGADTSYCVGDVVATLVATTPGAVSYQWYFNNNPIAGATSSTYTPVNNPSNTGTYSVVVSVGTNCDGNDATYISFVNTPTVSVSDVTYCSGTAATLTANAPSGVTYSWTGPGGFTGNTQTVTPTGSGVYTVVVTAGSCSASTTATATEIEQPTANLGNDVGFCAGGSSVLDPGYAPNTQFGTTYSWTLNGASTGGNTQTLTATQNGTYIVTITNSSGGTTCVATDTINVNVITAPTVTIGDVSYCQGGAQPQLTATTNVSGFNFSWTGPGGFTGNTQTVTATNGTGQYIVTVSDPSGSCPNATATANVTEIENPTPSLSNQGVCQGVDVTLNSNYPANSQFGTTYSWTGPGGFSGNTQSVQTNGAGTYTVTVTNTLLGVTCTNSASMNLTWNPIPSISVADEVTCQNSSGNASVTLTSSASGVTYQWFTNGAPIPNATNATYTTGISGTYVVEVDASGCKNSDTATVTINALPAPALIDSVTSATENVLFCANTPPVLLSGFTSGSNLVYVWTLNGQTLINSGAVLPVTEEGTYAVTITDANGCSATDEIIVIEEPCDIIPHNVITPDLKDGLNDVLVFENLLEFAKRKLQVFDRWGKLVYEADPYNNNWNGGDEVSGTYYYILEINNNIDTKKYHGDVMIIRE